MRPFPVSHWGSGGFNSPTSLFVPLTHTLAPSIALGASTYTASVSGAISSVIDWEGQIKRVKAGEARFMGARRVQNLVVGNSENLTNANWTSSNSGAGSASPTITGNFATDPLGGSTASRLELNMGSDSVNGLSQRYVTFTPPYTGVRKYRWTAWIKSNSGTPTIALRISATPSGTVTVLNITLTSSWVRYSTNVGTTGSGDSTTWASVGLFGTLYGAAGNSTTADILVWGAQFEDVSGQSNTNPSEYVSIGVASSPYHGAIIDGVKYFNTKNGYTVSSNVVVEGAGSTINIANGGSTLSVDASGPFGFMSEYGSSNQLTIGTEDLGNWTLAGMTAPAASAIASPAGYATDNALVQDGSTGLHAADHNFTLGSASNLCFASLFFKAGNLPAMAWRMHDGTHGVQLDLQNITTTPVISSFVEIGTQFTLGNTGLIAYPNGWYRVWCTFTKNGSTAFAWQNWTRQTNGGSVSYTGTNGQLGIYLWGFYINQGFPAEYIHSWSPDSNGMASPALIYPFASNASATVGTVLAEVKTFWSSGMTYTTPAVAFANSPSFPLYNNNEASTIIRCGDGTNNVQKTGLTDMSTAVRKRAASWTGTTLLVGGDGVTPASGTFDGNMGSTGVSVGMANTFNGNAWNGTIRGLRIYTQAANAAQLAFITT